jgi:uncharacterized protein (TIGR00296 family)
VIEEAVKDLLRKVAIGAATRATGARSLAPAPAPAPDSPACDGIFVTWLKDGRPRGRSGTLSPDAPLPTLVETHAVEALLRDPRVPPATARDLPRHAPQISLLSAFEEISSPSEVIVGTHGVVAEKGKRSGVVLPQDAEGLGWDGDRLVGQACLRAGLPEESWKTAGSVRLRRFTAETF